MHVTFYIFQKICKVAVQNSGNSYKELAEELAVDNTKVTSPEFVLQALRLFIGIPLMVIQTRMVEKGKGRQKSRVWEAYPEFFLPSDKDVPKGDFRWIMAHNGHGHFSPVVNLYRAELNKSFTPLMESIKETLEMAKDVKQLVPSSSQFGTALNLVVSNLRTAHSLGVGADVATGAAAITEHDIPSGIPLPATSASTTKRKRPATATQPSPAMDVDVFEPVRKKKTVTGPLQCKCGVQCVSEDDKEHHIKTKHTSNFWPCSSEGCTEKSYTDPNPCWRHFRKVHLNAYNYSCGYLTSCDYGSDEISWVKYHMETKHVQLLENGEVDEERQYRTDIRCIKCDHPFPQKGKLAEHEEGCGHKLKMYHCPDPDCPKSYRSKSQLVSHGKCDHPGDDETPKRVICEVCTNQYRSKAALRIHQIGKHT